MNCKPKILIIFLLMLATLSFLLFYPMTNGFNIFHHNWIGLQILRSEKLKIVIDEGMLDEFFENDCQKYWFMGQTEQSLRMKEVHWQKSLSCSSQYLLAIQAKMPDSKILAQTAVNHYPFLSQSWFWLGSIYKTDSPEISAILYQKGLMLDPYNGSALYQLAEALEADSQYLPAIDAYIKSCDYLNKGTDCYVRVGKIMEHLGDLKSAIYYYRLSIFPDAQHRANILEQQLQGNITPD